MPVFFYWYSSGRLNVPEYCRHIGVLSAFAPVVDIAPQTLTIIFPKTLALLASPFPLKTKDCWLNDYCRCWTQDAHASRNLCGMRRLSLLHFLRFTRLVFEKISWISRRSVFYFCSFFFFSSCTRLHRSSCPKRHVLILYVFPTLPTCSFRSVSESSALWYIHIHIYNLTQQLLLLKSCVCGLLCISIFFLTLFVPSCICIHSSQCTGHSCSQI